jgi:uncharacterized membrane protein YkvA (DUF1232 family)
MQTPEEYLKNLTRHFDQIRFLKTVRSYIKAAGIKVIYACLLLYYAFNRSETPGWAKRIILGSFAYLLAPIDMVPDLAPFFGFTDDLGVLMFGLVTIAGHVTKDVRVQAKTTVSKWFKNVDSAALAEVDKKI